MTTAHAVCVALLLVALACVTAAVAALAGFWWAVLLVGCAAGYGSYVMSTRLPAPGPRRTDGS